MAGQDKSSDSFLIVGIGASAGGLEAFKTFFRHMDEDSGMAFVLISHLSPNHESESKAKHYLEFLPPLAKKIAVSQVVKDWDWAYH